jgi:signal transduction histidine kinase
VAADGQVLASVLGGGLLKVAGDEILPYRFRLATGSEAWLADRDVKANKLLRDRDGGLWIGTQGLGLIHVKDGLADTYARADGLSGNIACGLFEDREGNIWYGSEKGLDRFRKLPVTTVSRKQGLPDEVTRSVLVTRDGSVWVATNDGLARWHDGAPIVYREGEGLPDSHVQSQYEDASGRHWVSTAKGLAYFADGRFVAVDGGPSREVYAITGDAEGNLWLSGDQGLAHLQHGRFVDNIPWAALGYPQRRAQVVVADSSGGLWLGFSHRSLVLHVKDGKVAATYDTDHGLGKSHIASLRIDAEDTLWAATGDAGLARIKDGRVDTLSMANGLPCNRIHWSTLDDQGALWLYTFCGLVKVGRADMAAWAADPARQVAAQVWGGADGVPLMINSPGYFNPPVAKGADGKLWFKGAGEVQFVAPDGIAFNLVPPPVHVEAVVADHKSYAAAQGLRLPPLTRDITIEFAALTLVDPKSTRFRYRLEGHDNDWQAAVDQRQATYTNLAPGSYRFHVKAANNSGVWNEKGAELEFSIQPAFYQTSWFRVACAVLLMGLTWGAVQLWLRMRIVRLQRQFEATLEGRVAERTRIARDLHDTLLQRFHGLLLQFQAASNLLPDRPREANQLLTRAIDQVAEAITEGRDTVRGLRASPQETTLAEALRTLADQLAKESGHAATVPVEERGTPRPLHPLVRDEVLRIGAEALRNALRHADAPEVAVEICYGARRLQVRVRDNGKGIAPEVLQAGGKEGHFGLGGMRERAELVGGALTVRSGPQSGTEVEFSAPASRAYSGPGAAGSWLRRRKFALGEIAE